MGLKIPEGQVIDQAEEFMRNGAKGDISLPRDTLTKKMEANMRQMQDTRKISC